MSNIAVRMDHVSKKFRKGEIHDSLRDLIPAFAGRLLGKKKEETSDSPRDFWALKDISFEVRQGEAFGIVGPNGAGKSTMLKLLSRIMRPTTGTFEVQGRLSALIEVAAGFHPDLTGRENVFLSGAIYGMSKREITSKFDEIVAFAGLEDFMDTPVKRYSSGMYARLGFSVASHVNPDVLIVDEVLSVGDYAFQKRCMDKMRSVIQSGATVLFVSHNLKAMTELCSRCLLLQRGRMIDIGPSEDVIRTYIGALEGGRVHDKSQEAVISRVSVRDKEKECQNFKTGERAWVDIEVTARKRCRKLSVSLYIMDSTDLMVMDTSTERLGYESVDLEEGQTFRCTFELDLNLVGGTFYVSSLLFRYDITKEYDRWFRASTLFIASDQDVRGLANCFPRVIDRQIFTANEREEVPMEQAHTGSPQ
ncbi:MAG TPA: ABC transporter ATP-binding protein [Terriglobales bacterium]|jgi:lipopolysaccharide transport system ATP-binding protein|nr:ABC transporter ATP-binding protein [Terriglobales bacterium]